MVRSCTHHVAYIANSESVNCNLHHVVDVHQCSACSDFKLRKFEKPARPTGKVVTREPRRGNIGTRLAAIIQRESGCTLSCSECESDLARMNLMSGEAVLGEIDIFAQRIVERGQTRAEAWWQRLFCVVAQPLAIKMVQKWITEAARGPQVQPTIIDPERFAGRCVVVTSLSPRPERAERQSLCLQSWRDIGLPVVIVDTEAKPRIKDLLNAGAATGLPFMVINSDIEISGDHAAIEEALAFPDKLTIGIRYNHNANAPRSRSQREGAGLDVFMMTPKMAETVPDLPFTIGQPVWDYWLPHHFRSLGHGFHWLREPLLFHARHDVQWSRQDWVQGSVWLREHYGINLEYGSTSFRDGLNDSLEVLI